jgi:hypothetical protein
MDQSIAAVQPFIPCDQSRFVPEGSCAPVASGEAG